MNNQPTGRNRTFVIGFSVTSLTLAALGLLGCMSEDTTAQTSDKELALSQNGGGTCEVTLDGDRLQQSVEVFDVAGPGGNISLSAQREVDLSVPGANSLREEGIIRIGNASKVYSYSLEAKLGSPTRIEVEWGPHVRGAEHAEFLFEDGMLTGTIDGREFDPFPVDGDPVTAVFLDGGPSPELLSAKPLKEALQRLEQRAAAVQQQCEGLPLEESSEGAQLLLQAANRTQDPGHFSDTYSTLECDGCKALVIGGGALGGIGCGVACVASFGLACGACIAGDAAAVTAGILACETSNACCPETCADGIGSSCCFGDETCLNPGSGLCCSSNTIACAGTACCASDQSCIDAGPNKGTCCPDDFTCGQNCCDEGKACQNAGTGQCCSPDKICGSVCCDSGELDLFFCADASQNLCCGHGQATCGGQCCGGPGSNKECRNNQCVFKETLECGSRPVCIDPQTGEQILSDSECPYGGGGAPGFCNLVTGCCDNPPA